MDGICRKFGMNISLRHGPSHLLLALFCLATLVLLLLCAGCATTSLWQIALEHEKSGDLEAAYKTIDEAYQSKPESKEIAADRSRIADALSLKYLKEEKALPPENLPMRQSLLREAQGIGSRTYGEEIRSRLEDVNAKIAQLEEEIATARSTESLFEAIRICWNVKEYELHVESLRDLKQYIENSARQISAEADRLAGEGKADEAIVYCRMAEHMCPTSPIIKDIVPRLLAGKSRKLLTLSRRYEKVAGTNRLATALLYALAAYRICPSNEKTASRVHDLSSRARNAYAPRVSLRFSEIFSQSLRREFSEAFAKCTNSQLITVVQEGKGKKQRKANVYVQLELHDMAMEMDKKRTVEYSKYVAGYRQVPNPEYQDLQAKLSQARSFAATQSSSGLKTVKKLEERLNVTPPYKEVPVYQSYQYLKEDFIFRPTMSLTYSIIDKKDKILLKKDTIKFEDTVVRTRIEAAHPQDQHGIYDKEVDQSEAEKIPVEFRKKQFSVLAQKIFDVIRLAHLHRAKDSLAEGYDDAARDEILAYMYLYSSSSKGDSLLAGRNETSKVVGKGETFEINLSTTGRRAHFNARLTWAVFTSPSGKRINVHGTWDGHRTWKVSLVANEVGVWKYETFSPTDGLDNIRGQFACLASSDHYKFKKGGALIEGLRLEPVIAQIDKILVNERQDVVLATTSKLDFGTIVKNTAVAGLALPGEFAELRNAFASWDSTVVKYKSKDRLVRKRKLPK
jgi:hypothetical protein